MRSPCSRFGFVAPPADLRSASLPLRTSTERLLLPRRGALVLFVVASFLLNPARVWPPSSLAIGVQAIADVPAGAELTISYLNDTTLFLPADHRAGGLLPYGFSCQCSRCQLPAEPLIEGVRCPACSAAVCSFQRPDGGGAGTAPGYAPPDGVYVCISPLANRGAVAPCGASPAPAILDAQVTTAFVTMQSVMAVRTHMH